jgi:hypothetical protein
MKFICSIVERIFYVARKAAKYPRVPLSVRSWSSPPAFVSLRSSSKITLWGSARLRRPPIDHHA